MQWVGIKEMLVTLELLNHFIAASNVEQLNEIVNINLFVMNLLKLFVQKTNNIQLSTHIVWMMSNIALDSGQQRDFLISNGILSFVTKVSNSLI